MCSGSIAGRILRVERGREKDQSQLCWLYTHTSSYYYLQLSLHVAEPGDLLLDKVCAHSLTRAHYPQQAVTVASSPEARVMCSFTTSSAQVGWMPTVDTRSPYVTPTLGKNQEGNCLLPSWSVCLSPKKLYSLNPYSINLLSTQSPLSINLDCTCALLDLYVSLFHIYTWTYNSYVVCIIGQTQSGMQLILRAQCPVSSFEIILCYHRHTNVSLQCCCESLHHLPSTGSCHVQSDHPLLLASTHQLHIAATSFPTRQTEFQGMVECMVHLHVCTGRGVLDIEPDLV